MAEIVIAEQCDLQKKLPKRPESFSISPARLNLTLEELLVRKIQELNEIETCQANKSVIYKQDEGHYYRNDLIFSRTTLDTLPKNFPIDKLVARYFFDNNRILNRFDAETERYPYTYTKKAIEEALSCVKSQQELTNDEDKKNVEELKSYFDQVCKRFNDFQVAYLVSKELVKHIATNFNKWDLDKDGSISKQDVTKILNDPQESRCLTSFDRACLSFLDRAGDHLKKLDQPYLSFFFTDERGVSLKDIKQLPEILWHYTPMVSVGEQRIDARRYKGPADTELAGCLQKEVLKLYTDHQN